MDKILDKIMVQRLKAEAAHSGDIFLQLPVDDWHMLRQYMTNEYGERHRRWCDYQREHFLFQGMAIVAGADWQFGEVI